jgi:hypothetical protein
VGVRERARGPRSRPRHERPSAPWKPKITMSFSLGRIPRGLPDGSWANDLGHTLPATNSLVDGDSPSPVRGGVGDYDRAQQSVPRSKCEAHHSRRLKHTTFDPHLCGSTFVCHRLEPTTPAYQLCSPPKLELQARAATLG